MSVRIPQSGGRNSKGFAKLVERVDARRADAFAFSGRFLKPGSLVDELDVRPPGWPDPPLLLEFVPAEGAVSGWRRHQADGDTWILWTWRAKTGAWEELGRTTGHGGDWVQVLRPIALAHLAPPPLVWRRTLSEARERIEAAVDAELESVEPHVRAALLSVVHDVIASRASFLDPVPSPARPAGPVGGSVGPEESRPTNTTTVLTSSLLFLPYMHGRSTQSTGGNSPSPVGESNRDSPSPLGESRANESAIAENLLANALASGVEFDPVASLRLTAAEREVLRKITQRAGRASAAKFTPEERTERARRAAQARYAKRDAAKQQQAEAASA